MPQMKFAIQLRLPLLGLLQDQCQMAGHGLALIPKPLMHLGNQLGEAGGPRTRARTQRTLRVHVR